MVASRSLAVARFSIATVQNKIPIEAVLIEYSALYGQIAPRGKKDFPMGARV